MHCRQNGVEPRLGLGPHAGMGENVQLIVADRGKDTRR